MHCSVYLYDRLVSENIRYASTFITRFWGLMREKKLDHDAGMIITPCNQVHTFFMKFAIDVVFCDKNWKVLEVINELKPGKITKYVKNAKYVLELSVGRAKELGIVLEDQLHIYFDGGSHNEEKKLRDA